MKPLMIALCLLGSAVFSAGCTAMPIQDNSKSETRLVWITLSAEDGTGATIVDLLIDGSLVSNVEDLQGFSTPDKAKQVAYFPLPGGAHTVEAISAGYTTFKQSILILPGAEGAQNLHIHMKRAK